MTVVIAAILAFGVYLTVAGGRRRALADDLSMYLIPVAAIEQPSRPPRTVPWLTSVIGGGLCGILVAQGDLFLAGSGRSIPALTAIGATGGYIVWSMRRTNAAERRARRLRAELPTVADALALEIIAGGSVASAIRAVTRQMSGVAIEELDAVLVRCDSGGFGLEASLLVASRSAPHPDARRLYDLLGHAHTSGGRLATMLAELALDLRAGIERDLSSEGGKRAVASYGPILALMVPTALMLLLYPTLMGLRSLAGGP